MSKPRVPVVEGLFTEDGGRARLLGGRCPRCGATFFPKQWSFCRNPQCQGGELADCELSTHGTLWSFTDNQYAPPDVTTTMPAGPSGPAPEALRAESAARGLSR